MERFDRLRAVAAPLPWSNVDTDKILPARFLKTIHRAGLGKGLFHTVRYDDTGRERPDFILNKPVWRNAGILIALENFGCGSSREHAPWALADFGIRCIIACSFADIFYNNCFKNGILPIILDAGQLMDLLRDAGDPARATFDIDLPGQTIARDGRDPIPFDIAPDRKRALMLGLDEIAETLRFEAEIAAYETGRAIRAPEIPLTIGAGAARPNGKDRHVR